ncbi:MAG: DoxX family protein [Bosea sp.]|uniref:DoxX family protein n=1 Tax=Bosea sp. (in: a-proteobacteria) TaxID=1871050 RepID=UPI00238E4468|nr:DoxX family protein [Bosea sp. (in: a-proteobacteria)]MCP4736337.1 DoxX family protein [Bosea sp. (in: a-proteobacteria)]
MATDIFLVGAESAAVAGRLFLGGAFAFAGLRNIINRGLLASLIGARGVPLPAVTLWLGIVLQIIAGLMIICGIQVSLAALMLLAFLVAATPMFNNFWDHQGLDRANRINGFVANIAIAGGILGLIGQA